MAKTQDIRQDASIYSSLVDLRLFFPGRIDGLAFLIRGRGASQVSVWGDLCHVEDRGQPELNVSRPILAGAG